MSKIRRSKQINIDCVEELSAKYGTMDKNSPEVIYIRAKGRITPLIDKSDYSKDIISFKNNFDTIIDNNIRLFHDYFDIQKYIYNIDISQKGISFKKGSYIKFDIYVRPKVKKPFADYNEEIAAFLKKINNDIKEALELVNLKYINKTRKNENTCTS